MEDAGSRLARLNPRMSVGTELTILQHSIAELRRRVSVGWWNKMVVMDLVHAHRTKFIHLTGICTNGLKERPILK